MRIIGSGYDGDLNLTSVTVEEDGREYRFEMPRWISVEERLPEHDTMVLVYVTNSSGWYSIETDMFYSGGWLNSPDDEWHHITHWMFLPEPPEEESP